MKGLLVAGAALLLLSRLRGFRDGSISPNIVAGSGGVVPGATVSVRPGEGFMDKGVGTYTVQEVYNSGAVLLNYIVNGEAFQRFIPAAVVAPMPTVEKLTLAVPAGSQVNLTPPVAGARYDAAAQTWSWTNPVTGALESIGRWQVVG